MKLKNKRRHSRLLFCNPTIFQRYRAIEHDFAVAMILAIRHKITVALKLKAHPGLRLRQSRLNPSRHDLFAIRIQGIEEVLAPGIRLRLNKQTVIRTLRRPALHSRKPK